MGKPEESKEVSEVSSEAQASKLLEQALIEMDGIISGNSTSVVVPTNFDDETNPDLITEVSRKLAIILQNSEVILPPEPEVRDALYQWIQMYPHEADRKKSNAELQIQVLSEQIEAQSEKILDLQEMLQDKQKVINEMEKNLQREFLSRSKMETQIQELLSLVHRLDVTKSALEMDNMSKSYQMNNCVYCMSAVKSKPAAENNLLSEKHHTNKVFKENSTCHIEVFHSSLPRQQYFTARQDLSPANVNNSAADVGLTDNMTCGKVPSHVGIRVRGQSVPNLENEKMYLDDSLKTHSADASNKTRKIWKILNLMRRSGSGNLHDISNTTMLTRGGVRATTGGRLGWSEPHLSKEAQKPLEEWQGEDIYKWLQDLGLEQYVPDAKKWLKTDQQLEHKSIFDLEKNLPIKNVLHKKKLHLALLDLQDTAHTNLHLCEAGNLDTSWVLRWLDDIGLPQHKEQFLINKIDGRMLHQLTFDDLSLLHITSMLHVTSIKRGIQVLRENDFNPNCLQRRSLSEDAHCLGPEHISLWTTHRVMEWLRSVDLAEYAPNLRGAGVHGGLIVYEAKFTSDLLATLLSIPPGKTLLRRHLSTRFKELLGTELIQKKRDAAATIGYIPLTPSTKFKVSKRSQFSLKLKSDKKTRDEDLVCPLDTVNVSDGEEGGASRGCIL